MPPTAYAAITYAILRHCMPPVSISAMLTHIISSMLVIPLVTIAALKATTTMAEVMTARLETPPGRWFLPRMVANRHTTANFEISAGCMVIPARRNARCAPLYSTPTTADRISNTSETTANTHDSLLMITYGMRWIHSTSPSPMTRNMPWRISGEYTLPAVTSELLAENSSTTLISSSIR